jgi:hypothetical protein
MTSLKLKLAYLAPVFAALAACASNAPEVVLTAEGEQHGAGVCATIDYGHTIGAEYYRQFDNDALAADYVQKLLASGSVAALAGPNATLKEITSDARLVRIVHDVYEGFKRTFPRETAGLPDAPRVALLETDVLNAFALGSRKMDDDPFPRAPWIFFVNTALLNHDGATDVALAGVFAHELGHLILRTFEADIQRRVRAIYMIQGSEDGIIGEDQNDDPHVAAHVEDILKIQDRIGGIGTLGLPFYEDTKYLRIVEQMMSHVTPEADPGGACAAAKTAITDLKTTQATFLPGVLLGDLTPRALTSSEKTMLEQRSAAVADKLRQCVAPLHDHTSFQQLLAALNGLPPESVDPSNPEHEKLLALMLPAELSADAEAGAEASLLDRILRATTTLTGELTSLQDDPAFPIDQIRVYDYEEDADDASVRVLKSMGTDPTGVGLFFLSVLPQAARDKCVADVVAGRPIAYGRFIDTHPSTCWRYYHAKQFANALNACGGTPADVKTAPKGSGRPSILDGTMGDQAEKGFGRGRR